MNPLVDPYDRCIRYVRLSVTDRCNLRCRYCMPAEGVPPIGHDEVLRYEELLRLLGVMAGCGVEKVRLTGGEPLVRRGLTDFVARTAELGFADLALTTNGVLLESMAAQLKAAGLHRVNVSLDTLKKERFHWMSRVDALSDVLAGVEAALGAGLDPVKLNAVIIRGFNDDEVEDLAALSLSWPVEVRFIELMPLGCALRVGSGQAVPVAELRERLETRWGALEPEPRGLGPASVWRLPGARGRIGFIGAVSEEGFCSRCTRLRVTASGELRPCLFATEGIDTRRPLRAGATDEQLESLVREAVRRKPAGHNACAKTTLPLMNRIGG